MRSSHVPVCGDRGSRRHVENNFRNHQRRTRAVSCRVAGEVSDEGSGVWIQQVAREGETARAVCNKRPSPKCYKEAHLIPRELRAVYDDAVKLTKRTQLGRFLHSSSDAKAVSDIKEKIAVAHRNFQVSCRSIQSPLYHTLIGCPLMTRQMEGNVTTEAIVTETLNTVKVSWL